MTSTTSRFAYDDVYVAMDRALADGKGVRVKQPSLGQARQTRLRFHKARKLDRDYSKEVHHDTPDHPMFGHSVYDRLIVSIVQEGDAVYLYITVTDPINMQIEALSEIEEKADGTAEFATGG